MKSTFLILLAAILGVQTPARGQQRTFQLTGDIRLAGYDTIVIDYYEYYVPHTALTVRRDTLPLSNGKFQYQLEKVPYHPFHLQLYALRANDRTRIPGMPDNFIIFPGDQPTLTILPDTIYAHGQGSESLNAQLGLHRIQPPPVAPDLITERYKGLSGYQLLLENEQRLDSILHVRTSFLTSVSKALGDTATHLLALELTARRYLDFFRTLEVVLPRSKPNEGSVVANLLAIYYANYDTPPTPDQGDTLAAYARDYGQYVFRSHLLKNYISNAHQSGFNTKADHTALYKTFAANYSGILRDCLLARCMIDFASREPATAWIQKVTSDIKTPALQTVLKQKFQALKEGLPFFAFSLPNTAGHLISDDVFRDKITLVDFWYTGCSACIFTTLHLKSALAELSEKHPDFQVVSINIDKTESMWKKSVASGDYTHPNAINLYTSGQRLRHPMIMHYDIQAYPRFMLVDKRGRVIESKIYPSPQSIMQSIRTVLDN